MRENSAFTIDSTRKGSTRASIFPNGDVVPLRENAAGLRRISDFLPEALVLDRIGARLAKIAAKLDCLATELRSRSAPPADRLARDPQLPYDGGS